MLVLAAYGTVTGDGFVGSVLVALWLTGILTPVLAVLAVVVAAIWTTVLAARGHQT